MFPIIDIGWGITSLQQEEKKKEKKKKKERKKEREGAPK